jgi:hypothetical protein
VKQFDAGEGGDREVIVFEPEQAGNWRQRRRSGVTLQAHRSEFQGAYRAAHFITNSG